MSKLNQKTLIHHQTLLSPLQCDLFEQHQVKVWIKRDDLNHPTIQGNKLHKLKFNLKQAEQENKDTLLTFGGAYSNHIAATAAAGQAFGFKTIGLIRGEELANRPETWSRTLHEAQANGMRFIFLSREAYRRRHDPQFLMTLQQTHPSAYLLPEGGTNLLAVQGFQTLSEDLEAQCPAWNQLYTAVGTGGTLAGLARYSQPAPERRIFGVATLKESRYLLPEIRRYIDSDIHWQLLETYHAGGYAKTDAATQASSDWFETTFNISLDPVYTAKMVHAFIDRLRHNQIPPGSRIILYHSGGLQGRV